MLKSAGLSWLDVAHPDRVLDLGCGDGDLGLLLAMAGHGVDLVDSPETNQNKMAMVRHLAAKLPGEARVLSLDLDRGLRGIAGGHSVAFALGLLYHLRNPALFLGDLAEIANYAFVSTRVIDAAGGRCNAYLVDDVELGRQDTTNYWLFTPDAFQRLLRRNGWKILALKRFGARTGDAGANDARMAVLIESTWSVFGAARFAYGLHHVEYGSYRWTARRFGIAVRQREAGRVIVTLHYFLPAAGKVGRTMVVTTGGAEVWRAELAGTGERSAQFAVAVQAGTTVLDVDCAEAEGASATGDTRSLGVVLRVEPSSPPLSVSSSTTLER